MLGSLKKLESGQHFFLNTNSDRAGLKNRYENAVNYAVEAVKDVFHDVMLMIETRIEDEVGGCADLVYRTCKLKPPEEIPADIMERFSPFRKKLNEDLDALIKFLKEEAGKEPQTLTNRVSVASFFSL
ncbi:hypothetical protein COB11_00510 [Candidatus Aerophobetes bacterium]|uniref:Uncharacterized protein n=1 Tax=Aerophobetes bacterium TaxID=2030807 RepID=A0A2A4YMN5_UNCAE|nr:MAG: hypothetical protein COB11_00510 [Candidatus Aerophobetes bacterium]